MGERLIIRSYRRVFEVDRRIYRVDRWALPVPGGIPLRGVGYFVTTVLGIVVLGALPASGELLELLSPPLRYVVLPLLVAVLGTQVAPDGRAAHRFAADWLRLQVRARRRCADRVVALEGEAVPWHGELALRWDGHGTELRRGRVRGPARVTFNVPVQLRDCDGRLQARPHAAAEARQAVVLCGGAVLEVSR
jgi:hypothetical protein